MRVVVPGSVRIQGLQTTESPTCFRWLCGAHVVDQLPPPSHEHVSSRRQRCNGLVDSEVVVDLVKR